MTVDARAEAEKRYPAMAPDDDPITKRRGHLRNIRRGDFAAGAAWALREFGDWIDDVEGEPQGYDWASEAHHIADGIENDE